MVFYYVLTYTVSVIIILIIVMKKSPWQFILLASFNLIALLGKHVQHHLTVPRIIRFHLADFACIPAAVSDIFLFYVILKVSDITLDRYLCSIFCFVSVIWMTLDEIFSKSPDIYDVGTFILGGVFTFLIVRTLPDDVNFIDYTTKH